MNYVFTNGYWHIKGTEPEAPGIEPGQAWGRIDNFAPYSTVIIDELDSGVVYVVRLGENGPESGCYGYFYFLASFGLIVDSPKNEK